MGRFFLGFAVGAALGAAVVLLSGQGDDTDGAMGLTARTGGVKGLLAGALDAGRSAAGAKEQEMLADFRTRLRAKPAQSSHRDLLAGL
ncbi:MAG: hypothetical protein RLZZ387_954 [Chloroflexota bacterium]|jgi:hypothetical protein